MLAALVPLTGCTGLVGWFERPAPSGGGSRVEPLPVQQARAYPKTVTGLFVSLADFEDSPARRGVDQVGLFSTDPSGGEGSRRFVLNITRTGAGAMQVDLAGGAELVFRISHVHDFTPYTLLSMALYSETLRDDLQVTLTTDRASWTSHRTLVRPGWNYVLIDIQRLKSLEDFDSRKVRTLRLAFADAAGPVTFYLDDIMLINNRRLIEPAPPGIQLTKEGLNYTLTLPGRETPLTLSQSPDGLWRLGLDQAVVQLAPRGGSLDGGEERLELMGPRRVGQVEVLENNPVRVRLASTWFFPTRAGEWASLAVRQIRWEYTFYGDGRWVTHLELNNAGGQEIGSLRIRPAHEAFWSSLPPAVGPRPELAVKDFPGTVGKWSYLCYPPKGDEKSRTWNYVNPGSVTMQLPRETERVFAPGDVNKDGFDESQGCYFLPSKGGQCRFVLAPPAVGAGLLNPVFRVDGKWDGPVTASSTGMAIRNLVRLDDGSVLFMLPGFVPSRTLVEVIGGPAGAGQ